jgi:heme/copper-type cytochrome/quinol oxidase subunit 4
MLSFERYLQLTCPEAFDLSRDPLHRLLVVNLLSGALIGVLFVTGLLWTDAYGLRTLMMRDSDGMIALLALCAGCIITSASVVAGSAIMMNRKSDDDDDHRGGPGIHELVPVKVRARS